MEKFNYAKSVRVAGWGLGFDSVLELKYAIWIHAEYEFLYAPVPIFYDPVKRSLIIRPRGNARRYTPDFLIRHRVTRKAYWVEVKPEKYTDDNLLLVKQRLAVFFIAFKKLDWEFKVVYGDEIRLSMDQLVQFNECCSFLFSGKKIPDNINPFRCSPTPAQIQYVMYGLDKHKSFWKR